MGLNLDTINQQKSFEWPIKGMIFDHPFEFVGILKACNNKRKNELLQLIGAWEKAIEAGDSSEDLRDGGPLQVAKELLLGWVDPAGEIVLNGEPLPSSPENAQMLLETYTGVDVAVCQAWFRAASGQGAAKNLSRSAGFGRRAS